MTVTAFTGGGIYLPEPIIFGNGAPTFDANLLIDASTEKVAFVFQVPKTGTLDKLEFRAGTIGSFNASSRLRISFQDLDLTTGDPDGVQDQYRDIASLTSATWTIPGLMTSDGTDTGTKRSVTKGELLTVVFEYQVFTAADSVRITNIGTSGNASNFINLPYADLNTGGTWAKQGTMIPVCVLKYNDGTYYTPPGCLASSALNTITTFNTGSTPDERGLLFQLPFPFQLEGFFVRLDLDGDADVILYDGSDNVLKTISLDKDVRTNANANWLRFIYSSVYSGLANTSYRLIVKPTSATNVQIYDWDVNSSSILTNYSGGSTWKYTQRTDAGAWTDTDTKRPFMGLILSGFDDGLSGGVKIHQGMQGGLAA